MKHLLGISAALLATTALVGPVSAAKQGPVDLVKAAVEAQGGETALKALKAVTVKATAKHWEPGQSLKAAGEPRFLSDTSLTITFDIANSRAKMDLQRAMVYPPPAANIKYTEVITPTGGFVTQAN